MYNICCYAANGLRVCVCMQWGLTGDDSSELLDLHSGHKQSAHIHSEHSCVEDCHQLVWWRQTFASLLKLIFMLKCWKNYFCEKITPVWQIYSKASKEKERKRKNKRPCLALGGNDGTPLWFLSSTLASSHRCLWAHVYRGRQLALSSKCIHLPCDMLSCDRGKLTSGLELPMIQLGKFFTRDPLVWNH